MDRIKAIFVSVASAISSALGILFLPVLLLVSCNIMDYITGIMASIARGEKVTSKTSFLGICKKICQWLLVVVGVVVDKLIGYAADTVGIEIPFTFLIACVVAIWLVANEVISILENIAETGVPIPEFLEKIVKYIKDQAEEKSDISKSDNLTNVDNSQQK